MTKTFALIKERKNPPDRRVVFSPEKCKEAVRKFPEAKIIVESSDVRVFPDEAYRDAGFEVTENVSAADVLLGVKEVPIEALVPGKKYFFFSHTIKKQPYNQKLLRAVLDKKIELFDHETVVDENNHRLIGFGYYAGLVGAYNAFRGLGIRDGVFELPKVENLPDLLAVKNELDKIRKKIPAKKIVFSGGGKVARGVREILEHLKIKEVDVEEYLKIDFEEAVFCNIDVMDYNKRIDGTRGEKQDFYDSPSAYESDFFRFAKVSDIFITGHFYGEGAPVFFAQKDAARPDFRIDLVADISCDVDGPVASTIRASTIAEPFYGYDPKGGKETDYRRPGAIMVMAVDNLPCELPKDASEGFGEMFLDNVLPAFFNNDKDGILKRAQMTTSGGKLTERFSYLKGYAEREV